MNEEQIIIQATELEKSVDVGLFTDNIETIETVEEIDIIQPEEMVIDVEEVTGVVTGMGQSTEHEHQIEQIINLENRLITLGSINETYSPKGGYAEFREWKDKNVNLENRTGYFVTLINNNDGNVYIDICNARLNDVYGVTVDDSGFCGYQYSDYNMLDEEPHNKADSDEPHERVCLLGTVMARVYSSANFDAINIGDFVVPDEYGCAVKSENNIGFKVIMKEAAGTGENAWNKVLIALVPQNDNVARVMKELEKTNEDVSTIVGQLGTLEETVNNNITISGDFKDLEEAFEKLETNVNTKFEIIETTYKTAQEISDAAKKAMENMHTNYEDAITQVEMAISDTNGALADISKYKDNLEILAQYDTAVAGFFSEASEDEVTIGTIAQKLDETNSNLSMIKQSSDVIQHLVCSVDIYSVGNQSPTDGLSYNEAQGALGSYEYIYVPINNHTETSHIYQCSSALERDALYFFKINSMTYSFKSPMGYTKAKLEFNARTNQLTIDNEKVDIETEEVSSVFELIFTSEKITEFTQGKSYKWSSVDSKYLWVEDKDVSFAENPPSKSYELWYTRNGIQDENRNYIYNPGTLYRLINELWVAVATINDNNSRTMSLINQTADTLSSTITNVAGDVSTIRQEVGKIDSIVSNHSGQLSEIEQTAENIIMGVHSPAGGSSSLELLLSGMQSNTVYTDHVLVCEILDTSATAIDGKYYSSPPEWNGTEFVFNESNLDNENGTYCFAAESKLKYYCNTDNGYNIYTIGNQAIASLRTRVTDTESAVESWTLFESEFADTMSEISQSSTKDAAELIAMVLGEFVHKVEGVVSPTEEQLAVLSELSRYSDKPNWNGTDKMFVSKTQADDGKYCISEDGQYYYELTLDSDGNIVGYEKYEMKSSNYASLVQKVDGDKSYVGLVAGNDDNMGSVVAQTINDKSSVLIEADKIGISGTAVFSDSLAEGKTTISGNYIGTGVIKSNNYSGPVTYKMYGAKIENNTIVKGDISDCIYYAPIKIGTITFNGDESTITVYLTNEIRVDVDLGSGTSISSGRSITSTTYSYIVSNSDFDLIPKNAETFGTKFDLNNGTIYSKNLQLDRDGNLSITGKISATSGWIGDDKGNGFEICKDDSSKYYLGNNQTSYNDITKTAGTAGVYVGPDGIGLGHGNFYVTSAGSITAKSGNIGGFTIGTSSIYNSQTSYQGSDSGTGVYLGTDGIGLGQGKFYVSSSGDVTIEGNLTLGSGCITWSDISNKPTMLSKTTVEGMIESLANGEDTYGGTFINGTSIYGPKIYSNEFTVTPSNELTSGFSIYGKFTGNGYASNQGTIQKMLEIYYHTDIGPSVVFTSQVTGITAYWDFDNVTFNSNTTTFAGDVVFDSEATIDFQGANVIGLDNVTAVFG